MQRYFLWKIITFSPFQWRVTESDMLSLPPESLVYEMFLVVCWSPKQCENLPRLIPKQPSLQHSPLPYSFLYSFFLSGSCWLWGHLHGHQPTRTDMKKTTAAQVLKSIGAAVWADHDSALGSSDFTSTWVHQQASVCVWEHLYFLFASHYTCFLKVTGSTSNSIQLGWTVYITSCPS